MAGDSDRCTAKWTLEGVLPDGRSWVIPVDPLPFRIGRQRDGHLVLNSPSVSRFHAELYLCAHGLAVRDLGSTNGTFLNGHRLDGEVRLDSGDILHFGEVEFRVKVAGGGGDSLTDTHMALRSEMILPTLLPSHEAEFAQLLEGEQVRILFQPIVDLATGATAAYEAVARGLHPRLPHSPADLFHIADRLGKAGDLCRLLRRCAMRDASLLPGHFPIFVNIHASETFQPSLLGALETLVATYPGIPITLEISEKALSEPNRMRELKASLGRLGILLAYDDFGAGQTRILELIQAPPDVLKFDIALVKGLHESPPTTRRMLRSLVAMAADLGVKTLAEGVECEGEREACLDTGFIYGQGFFFGTPEPPPQPQAPPGPALGA